MPTLASGHRTLEGERTIRSLRDAWWRRRPDVTSNYSASHRGRGADYDEGFLRLPHRALMWELEQRVLDAVVATGDFAAVLDFACGTGRITRRLSEQLPGARIVGVDIAESMLDVARERAPEVDFINADGADLAGVVPAGSMDLVTAFRFFANADPELRARTTEGLATVVRPGGYLLLNNHRNFWSTSYALRRLRPGSPAPGATNADVTAPFRARDFAVAARWSLGVVPHNDEGAYLLPMPLVARLERFNYAATAGRHTLGSNTIWLLRRRE